MIDFDRFREPDFDRDCERCIECGEGIFAGDYYYYYDDEYYCMDCGQALKIDSEDFEINAERGEL